MSTVSWGNPSTRFSGADLWPGVESFLSGQLRSAVDLSLGKGHCYPSYSLFLSTDEGRLSDVTVLKG